MSIRGLVAVVEKGEPAARSAPTLLGCRSNPRAPAASGPAVIASSGPAFASLITGSVVHSNGSLGRGSGPGALRPMTFSERDGGPQPFPFKEPMDREPQPRPSALFLV